MEQNLQTKNKSIYIWSNDLWQECQEYTRGKTQSVSTNGAGKTGYPDVKERKWTFLLYNTQNSTQNGLKT